jgi:hypothetical protein
MIKDKDRVFQLIGKITVQLATMEHRLQTLLETLMGDGNTLVGPLFIHEVPFAGLIKKIGLLAHCKIHDNSELLSELERVLDKLDDLREERNLLIHGDWKIEYVSSLRITVRDFKMKYDQDSLQEYSETEFTEKKLTGLNRHLEGLGSDVDYLVRKISEIQSSLKTCTKPLSAQ